MRAITRRYTGLRQRIPVIGVIGEMKLVLVGARRRDGRRLELVEEVEDIAVGIGIQVRDFLVPEVGVVDPRTQEVVLRRCRGALSGKRLYAGKTPEV